VVNPAAVWEDYSAALPSMLCVTGLIETVATQHSCAVVCT